jgi:hypothetical protein
MKPTSSLFNALLFAVLCTINVASHAAENSKRGTPLAATLVDSLKTRFYAMTPVRNAAFEKLNGQVDLRRWQDERRSFFRRQIGAFPERTPVNARVVGRLQGEGYRVEKVMFESRPGHHVTASLVEFAFATSGVKRFLKSARQSSRRSLILA